MKTIRKLTALLSAAIMLCSGAAPVQAADPTDKDSAALWCWGTASGEAFQDMEQLDHKGMFGDSLLYMRHIDRYVDRVAADPETGEPVRKQVHDVRDLLYTVMPRTNTLRFVLRDGVDPDAAKQQITAIVQKYFPDVTPDDPLNPGTFDIYEADETKRTAEVSESLMHELAGAGLISAFYTWGETADYNTVGCGYLTFYSPPDYRWNSEHEMVEVTYDWDAVRAWVQQNHPECEFISLTKEDVELAKTLGVYHEELGHVTFHDKAYAVIPPDGTTYKEHFALAAELYEQFGLCCGFISPCAESAPLLGKNSLAAAGDVNLDCSVDVSDAVLVSRFAAEDREALITDQGRQNADVTHDGNVDAQDGAKLLQFIAKKISYQEMEGAVPAEQNISTPAVPDNTDPAEDYAFNVQCFRVGWQDGSYPQTQVITSEPALEAFLAVHENGWETEAPRCYTKEWFQSHKLLAVVLSEGSGSVSHEVTAVSAHEVKINRYLPGVGTCDMAEWLIMIELDRDADIADDIRVELTAVEQNSEGYAFSAQGCRTQWHDAVYPQTKVIASLPALEAYAAAQAEAGMPLDAEVLKAYTKEWFGTNKLLIVMLGEGSGSVTHEVTAVGTDFVSISRYVPGVCTCDMAAWYYLIGLDQSAQIADNIRVEINTYEQQG